MKKVGILTFHYGDNYGAVLQSYALRRTINSLPDCMAEIINYIPDNYLAKNIEAAYDDKASYLEKRKKFEKFLDTHCGVKKEMVQRVTGEEYDYLCVGSDQVWNPIYFDEEYFFLNASKGKKISYAASLGKPVKDCEFFADMYKHNLADFSFLTVRESEHVDFLKENTGKECTLVLDPTLLLKRMDYEQLMCLEDDESEDYILFFWLRDNDVFLRGLELVNSIARKYNYKIVHSIMGGKDYMFCRENSCMYYGGIEEFLRYIKHAKMVVTNSYHAMLFSVQFHVPFYVLGRKEMRSRIDTVNLLFDISDRMVEDYKPVDEIHMEMDFERIENVLERERKRSIEILQKMLEV